MESPFEVLVVDADADEEEIEQAYRKRVKEAHPDQGGSVEEFQAVRTAYERIKAGYEENGNGPQGNGAAPSRTSAAARAQSENEVQDPDERRERDQDRDATEEWNRDRRIDSEITYLNYDVLSDFGWHIEDDDLFEKAADADLGEVDHGRFDVQPGESLLEAAEDRGFAWPFACRGGACANCAILLCDGELSMPTSHVLPDELMERGFRLSCNAMPITSELKLLYNVKHVPDLEELLLPPQPFEQAYPNR